MSSPGGAAAAATNRQFAQGLGFRAEQDVGDEMRVRTRRRVWGLAVVCRAERGCSTPGAAVCCRGCYSPKRQRVGSSVHARKVAGSNPAVPMIRVALWTAGVAYCHVNVVIACGGMV